MGKLDQKQDAIASGFDQVTLIDWTQRWIADLATIRLGGQARFFPSRGSVLERLGEACRCHVCSPVTNEINQIRRLAQHLLNLRLALEDMLLRYSRAFSENKP